MKKILCLAAGLAALNLMPVSAQPARGRPPIPTGTLTLATSGVTLTGNEAAELTRFNLDFPGGTAAELVKAIEKATGKPLNVIIASDEKSAKAKLPPIKVTDMDVARLFKSLERRDTGRDYNDVTYARSFYTEDQPPKDNALWTFGVFEKQPTLTQFNLDFPGGTPALLVKAIEKAIGKPLNVVIADEDAATKIPALKMNDVNVAALFTAVAKASQKQVSYVTSSYYVGANTKPANSYSTYNTGYSFQTEGSATDNSVWYFHVEKPSLPPAVATEKTCQYFSLGEYLNRGFTVEDITTAIQTGWKLSGETAPPELNYHKETKLLMAYGEPAKLETITKVLGTLPMQKVSWQTLNTTINDVRILQAEVKALQQKIDGSANNKPTGAFGESKSAANQ